MRFKVPKDVDIEDRIVGPLTIKQVSWLGGGMGICILLYKTLDIQLFIFLGIIIMALSAGFAFIRPYNQSLIAFCGSVFLYLSKPKLYIWRRIGINFPRSKKPSKGDKENLVPIVRKGFSEKEAGELANTLDSGGNA